MITFIVITVIIIIITIIIANGNTEYIVNDAVEC